MRRQFGLPFQMCPTRPDLIAGRCRKALVYNDNDYDAGDDGVFASSGSSVIASNHCISVTFHTFCDLDRTSASLPHCCSTTIGSVEGVLTCGEESEKCISSSVFRRLPPYFRSRLSACDDKAAEDEASDS